MGQTLASLVLLASFAATPPAVDFTSKNNTSILNYGFLKQNYILLDKNNEKDKDNGDEKKKEKRKQKKKDYQNTQKVVNWLLAKALYKKMEKPKNLLTLCFERYSANDRVFCTNKNPADEKKELVFYANHHAKSGGRSIVIKAGGGFKNIESVIIKKYSSKGNLVSEKSISTDNKNALVLYHRMLTASIYYLKQAEIAEPPNEHYAVYRDKIVDNKFKLAFEKLFQ